MKRPAHRDSEESAALHSDAYSLQQGEFYPEHHQANVRRLHRKYPNFSLSEIDAIYREACRIDFEARKQVGATKLSKQAKEELMDWLEDHFYGFGRESFLQAIVKAESE